MTEVRQLTDNSTGQVFVPVTHWDAITNKPTIPSRTSDLQNDSGYITINDVQQYIASLEARITALENT